MVKKVKFPSVAIYSHKKPEKALIESIFIRSLIRFLHKRGVTKIHGDARTVHLLKGGLPLVDDNARYSLKIGIGGDGTLLKMIRTLQKKDGLFIGINFGTLGFLSELTPENALTNLAKIFRGEYQTDERMLLKGFVYRKNGSGKKEKIYSTYALNEIVLGHGGLARLTNFNLKADRRFITTYRSDGLIFSTPTGSTAYSMSAGGPIVSPNLFNLIITPVSAHTLTHRPIVLPADKVFHLDFDSRSDSVAMSTDGQVYFSLRSTDQVTIQRSTRTVKFIRMKESHYFRSLRNKLGWGN